MEFPWKVRQISIVGTHGYLWALVGIGGAHGRLDMAEAEEREGSLGILRKSGPQFQSSRILLITHERSGLRIFASKM